MTKLAPRLDSQVLRRAISTLPLLEQVAIHLRFWEEMEIEEIAELCQISWDRADQLVSRGLTRLKRVLSEKGIRELKNLAASEAGTPIVAA